LQNAIWPNSANLPRRSSASTVLQPWDVAYASEKLRVARYAFSDQEVKQYFPEQRVLEGMFRVVEMLYGLRVVPDEAPRWHEDVRFFSIRNSEGALVGQFYLDLYARPSKRGGAWMDDAITRRRKSSGMQTPVAYLNCNFSAPLSGKPALLTHDEVITLFHEFGHGLHHLLTQVEVLGVSGINGVEWDAVELPSQFMENFCWEWDVLKDMTRHVDTGSALPRALFEKMVAAKNFRAACRPSGSSNSRFSTCGFIPTSIRTGKRRRCNWSMKSGAAWQCFSPRITIAFQTVFRIYSAADMRPATTVINGLKSFPRMPTACSRRMAC
jgi:Zn-dependent oligopeptidase